MARNHGYASDTTPDSNSGFNGTAPLMARNRCLVECLLGVNRRLQWDRAFDGAESERDAFKALADT